MAAHGFPHIGIFDSGIGGLSVLAALRRQLPAAHCTYVADARYTPWGERSEAWVQARCGQLAGWLIEQGADMVLVACNTGTTQAISALRTRWPHVPFVGVEPGVKPAVALSRNQRVGVMATTGTLRSGRLQRLVDDHAGQATVVRLPCPGLVEAIEGATRDEAALQARLDSTASDIRAADVDTVVLGCTHYPLVASALQQRLGAGIRLVDTGEAVARRVASLLPALHVGPADAVHAAPGEASSQAPAPPLLRLLTTGDLVPWRSAVQRWVSAQAEVEALPLPAPTTA